MLVQKEREMCEKTLKADLQKIENGIGLVQHLIQSTL